MIMSERTGYNSLRTKNRNRGIVLRLIAGKQLSRADITKKIGLTKMAITKIVGELIEDGYIVEGKGESAPGVGRAPTFLEISDQSPVSLGLYISRNELAVIVCSFRLDRLFSESIPLKNESKSSLEEKIFSLCDKALRFTAEAFPERKFLGIGVSAVGPLDPSTGVILDPTNFYGITDYPVAELLADRYHLPVSLENDMNAAAIAEHFYGIGRVTDSFMYMGITNGIGAGIILDGRPCKLGCKSVGEIGHMSIQCEGPVCSCGNRGCLEVYANIPVITARLEKALGHPVLPKDFARYAEIGKRGVLLMLADSTNVERRGYTMSERKVGESFVKLFNKAEGKRIIIATFASNVHRVQQIIDIAVKYGRKVAITGRSMINVIGAAIELEYMKVPEGTLIDIADIKKYPPSKIVIVSTGSQGEPMSALYRMAFNMHDKVDIKSDDVVIISASAIPGNEKLVGNIINELYKKGVTVLSDSVAEVHVSGHACREELKIFHALTKPEYFMPVHGEARHLYVHKELAEHMGMPASHIFVSEIGKVLEIDSKGARFSGTVPSGIVLVDGYGVGDVGNVVLRDRKILSSDGIITIVTVIDSTYNEITSGPEIISRGFVYAKESEEIIENIKVIVKDTVNACLNNGGKDWNQIKFKVKDEVAKFVYAQTKRKPMIVPIIMEI